ncbi:MAG TPA: FecR family protein, partial [Chitinophagaceae bacterium]|nr:FecR family protein [Chitinophagaceae bacterium]
MAIARLDYLYERCMKGIATAEERQEFHSFVQLPENEMRLRELLQQAYREPKETIDMDADASRAILQAIFHATAKAASPVPVHRVHFIRRWWAVAAMLLLLLGSGSYLWLFRKGTADIAVTPASHPPEIQPGGNKAVLTLANGNKIILDSTANGIVTKQGRMHIVKLADGKLQYKGTDNSSSLNTLATPYGGQYRLTLSDGTVVWLNAASSVTYPTAFTGARREVTVRGEAYFEVMKDAATPFIVNVNDKAEIEVLGTHFNVNAYENEDSISTTLLEGAVKVTAGRAGDKDRPVILRPGQ